jgi:hypothetical protein
VISANKKEHHSPPLQNLEILKLARMSCGSFFSGLKFTDIIFVASTPSGVADISKK